MVLLLASPLDRERALSPDRDDATKALCGGESHRHGMTALLEAHDSQVIAGLGLATHVACRLLDTRKSAEAGCRRHYLVSVEQSEPLHDQCLAAGGLRCGRAEQCPSAYRSRRSAPMQGAARSPRQSAAAVHLVVPHGE